MLFENGKKNLSRDICNLTCYNVTMIPLKSLQLSKRVKQSGVTYARVLQDGKPVQMTTSLARLSISSEYDTAYVILLDKAFETNLMLLENWFLGECLLTTSPSCQFKSVIRLGSSTQKHSLRCKIHSSTLFEDASGQVLQKIDMSPQLLVECTLEAKCAYFTEDVFGISFVLKKARVVSETPPIESQCLIEI